MENNFLNSDFLLQSSVAKKLYHEHAEIMPIVDYHCHLSVRDIADDKQFANLTEAWLEGDHYKWRAMRACGVHEKYITGTANDFDKFLKYAETIPFTLRNPLYVWSHLELKKYFGINTLLCPETAEEVYNEASRLLQQKEFSVRGLLKKMRVKVLCTTDDPLDHLQYHEQLRKEEFEIKVYPTFRPDKAMNIECGEQFVSWVRQLEMHNGQSILVFFDFIAALKKRHDFFHNNGCRLSDHGIETFYASVYTDQEVEAIFQKGMAALPLTTKEIAQFKSCVLFELAVMNHAKGWVQQFHVGAIRNNNSVMFAAHGVDAGYDSIGAGDYCAPMQRFLDKLSRCRSLTKSIFYNLNPKDSEMMASMIANFNDGGQKGKMQYGAAWWFLDQKEGIVQQLNVLSNFSLLSQFVGMVTDSRSFLSHPRHEYFRRILCQEIAADVLSGEIPEDYAMLGNMVENVCYNNAVSYFEFPEITNSVTIKQSIQ